MSHVETTALRIAQLEASGITLDLLQTDALLDRVLSAVLRSVVNQLSIFSAGLWIYNAAVDTTLLYLDYEDDRIQLGDTILRLGASQHTPLSQWDREYMPMLMQKQVLIQTLQDTVIRSPQYIPVRQHNRKQGIRTIMVIPLFFQDNFLGNITLRSLGTFQFSSDRMNLALALANQAAIAIQFSQINQHWPTRIQQQPSLPKTEYIPKTSLTKRELNLVLDYIDRHLSRNIKLTELADAVGMSPSHFARLFKQSLGTTPHQYVMQSRLEAAKFLLKTPQTSLEQISDELGFANPGQFATFFRTQAGFSPSTYRQNFNSIEL